MESFVHLHVHTEYSMLDGAAKVGLLMEEVSRQGMPAVAMSDHGNVHGAYEFYQRARKAGIKPVIGIEAYVAPASRYRRQPVYYSDNLALRRSDDETGEGGDVSGRGLYTHMTMWAGDAQGLRNLFRLQSRAWLEGHVQKYPRMDDDLLAEHGQGIIATTGCPSGEVQTRLRLGQYDRAVEAAARYRDIFGKDNYFLELMDHGLAIERRVHDELLKLGKELDLPPLATNDSHYVTESQARAHDALLCVGTGKRLADTDRFRFGGSGYYLKSAKQMRALWDSEVPGACDNTLLIAERIGDYGEVFASRDLTPRFPVPEGESESSWLCEKTLQGARRRYGGHPPREVLDRIDYELSVIDAMGFPGYFLVVADICRYAREHGIGLGPGRGSATGSIVAYCTGIRSPSSIRSSTSWSSNGSSTPSASPCRTSTSTSTTGGATK
ncbi:PHP domain-containing protein [Micromonospora sp. NBC_01412]